MVHDKSVVVFFYALSRVIFFSHEPHILEYVTAANISQRVLGHLSLHVNITLLI